MYYGILVLLPFILEKVKAKNIEANSVDDSSDLVKLVISSMTEIIGAAMAAVLIDF